MGCGQTGFMNKVNNCFLCSINNGDSQFMEQIYQMNRYQIKKIWKQLIKDHIQIKKVNLNKPDFVMNIQTVYDIAPPHWLTGKVTKYH